MRFSPINTLICGLVFFSLAACAVQVILPQKNNPPVEGEQKQRPPRLAKSMVVLPFQGNPAVRRPAAEYLAYLLASGSDWKILSPELAEIELNKRGVILPEHRLSPDEAIAFGKMLGYELALVGYIVESDRKWIDRRRLDIGIHLEIEVRVIAVQSGKVLARLVAPGGGGKFTHENYTRRAIERANESLLRLQPELTLD